MPNGLGRLVMWSRIPADREFVMGQIWLLRLIFVSGKALAAGSSGVLPAASALPLTKNYLFDI